MTDTTREAFEAWKNAQDQAEPEPERTYELSEDGMNELIDSVMFQAWQAATDRATQVERERAAQVCDALVNAEAEDKSFKQVHETRGKGVAVELAALKFNLTVGHGNRMIEKCAAAIRQGGDTT